MMHDYKDSDHRIGQIIAEGLEHAVSSTVGGRFEAVITDLIRRTIPQIEIEKRENVERIPLVKIIFSEGGNVQGYTISYKLKGMGRLRTHYEAWEERYGDLHR